MNKLMGKSKGFRCLKDQQTSILPKKSIILKISVSKQVIYDSCYASSFAYSIQEHPQISCFDCSVRIGVVAQWCNPLTLQPEQLGGVGSMPVRTPPLLDRHDKGLWIQLGLN